MCGAACRAEDPFGFDVESHWGYESTGKDLSSDRWHMQRMPVTLWLIWL
jgi:hypothetical protein